jgi:cytidine deaminase
VIKAILFDVDGVLVDSEPLMKDVAVSVFKEFGIDMDPAVYSTYIGVGDRLFINGIAGLCGKDVDFAAVKKRLYEFYCEVASRANPIGGVKQFITAARGAGLKFAVATSAPRIKLQMNLATLGYTEDDFDFIVTGDKVKRTKPAPDIYQLAGLGLGFPLEECLVIEDSTKGVEAGKRAGATVMAITSSFKSIDLSGAGADFILDDYTGFPPFTDLESFNDALVELRSKGGEKKVFGAVANEVLGGSDKLVGAAIKVAYTTRDNAYAAYSHFKVGAAIISSKTNRIYGGCNVENGSYGATICAERGALMKMISEEGASGISHLVVVSQDNPPAPPCAICLQMLCEFCRHDTKIHLCDTTFVETGKGAHEVYDFRDLLPHPFVLTKPQ